LRHPASGRYPRTGVMSMTTETTADTDAVDLGRGGRMSRQRKRDAVLRLLRGEDVELVSRSLGVTAATLSSWREAFLAAGEASLATRPTNGEALESNRLKARLGEMLLERELLEPKSRRWRLVIPALCPGGDRDDEPDRFARQRHPLRTGPGVPGLAHLAGHDLPPPLPTADQPAGPAGSVGTDAGRGAGGGDPGRSLRQPVSWRGPPQGLGPVAHRRGAHLQAPRFAANARTGAARALARRRAAGTTQP